MFVRVRPHEEAISDYKKVWLFGNYGAEDVIDYVEAGRTRPEGRGH